MTRPRLHALATLALLSFPPHGNGAPRPEAAASPAFCLFEMPASPDRRVWLNLGIVQYIEQHAGELVIYYGGGRFGSGHEARIPLRNADDAAAFLARMQVAAARCAGR